MGKFGWGFCGSDAFFRMGLATALSTISAALAQEPKALTVDPVALQATLDTMAAEMLVPGAAMLLRTPQGEFTATFGVRGLNDPTPVTIDDHIRIGSNTKTWTGTVILQLVEEGRIALDDKVSKYRADVPNGDNITIEMLLNMRSGLFSYSSTFALNDALDRTPDRVWDPEELLAIAFARRPISSRAKAAPTPTPTRCY